MSSTTFSIGKFQIFWILVFGFVCFGIADPKSPAIAKDKHGELIECVKRYSEEAQCMTCVRKTPIGGNETDIRETLTKIIDKQFIGKNVSHTWTVGCFNCSTTLSHGINVSHVSDELSEILKLLLWLEYEKTLDEYLADRNELGPAYLNFVTKHRKMDHECLIVFNIPLNALQGSDDDDDDDDDDDFDLKKHLEKMAVVTGGFLSSLSVIGYIVLRLCRYYHKVRREYSILIDDSNSQ